MHELTQDALSVAFDYFEEKGTPVGEGDIVIMSFQKVANNWKALIATEFKVILEITAVGSAGTIYINEYKHVQVAEVEIV